MFDINKNDVLSKVHNYELARPEGRCSIDVHEFVGGEDIKYKFLAKPNLTIDFADEKYFGTGDSVDEALNNCLSKIKSVNMENLFYRLKRAKENMP